jgi:ribonuclease P protein component
VVLHVLNTGGLPTRFGFIVTKAVGTAVTRNLVKRRLRAVCRNLLPASMTGTDVVIRALPGSETATWERLRDEVSAGLRLSVSA